MTAKYLAIDPGETSGWATFDATGTIIEMGQFPMSEITKQLDLLITSDLELVICEDYRNYAWKQQKKWSRNDTSKIIGKIEIMCDLRGVEIRLEPASNKLIGYKWAGLGQAPTNHSISHQYDAIAHGVYTLQKLGIRPVGKAIPKNEL